MVQLIFSLLRILNKREYGSTHIVFLESFVQKTICFNPYCLLRIFSPKDNMVQLILSFKTIFTKDNMVEPILFFKKIFTISQYGSTHIVVFQSFVQNAIWFSPCCLFWKFCPKDKMVWSIFPFSNVSAKTQYGSNHIVVIETFDQKTIWFNPYCLFRKFSPKDDMVQPI